MKLTPRERAAAYARRWATNPNGVWGLESVRAMLTQAHLAGYRSAARARRKQKPGA